MTSKLLHIQKQKDLRGWAKRLGIFRYVTSKGGLDDDNGDKFVCVYNYKTLSELEQFFNFIDYKPNIFDDEPPKPKIIKGKLYNMEDRSNVPDIIPNTSWIEQPKHIDINGAAAFVWCRENTIEISPFENSPTWTVSEESVRKGEVMEVLLQNSPLLLIEPPVDSEYCLCPKYYPTYFC